MTKMLMNVKLSTGVTVVRMKYVSISKGLIHVSAVEDIQTHHTEFAPGVILIVKNLKLIV